MFFAVIVQPVATYLEQNTEELSQNGNEFLNCNLLQELKLAIQGLDDPETDFGIIQKTARLGVRDFRPLQNLAMLMRESERVGLLQKAMLDIVIDTINRRTGGVLSTSTRRMRTSCSQRSTQFLGTTDERSRTTPKQKNRGISITMSMNRNHNEWLSRVPNSRPFLSLPVLLRAFPQGLDKLKLSLLHRSVNGQL